MRLLFELAEHVPDAGGEVFRLFFDLSDNVDDAGREEMGELFLGEAVL